MLPSQELLRLANAILQDCLHAVFLQLHGIDLRFIQVMWFASGTGVCIARKILLLLLC